ncbi:hypothetical protein MKK65_08360 [Methylobacterium sp. J-001]|uniref:hypothetical protein n=1 Tax=Methylobacterium sp. J-001 TaxID=2836609 RepID=UPI001FBB105F|nr:hypothetical protein [Methylobacterium sp. J-001]MCJ2116586.1 hypothetical protein [Methylobacterium sp. J-001]
MYLTVKDEGTTASAIDFISSTLVSFPFRVTHIVTDAGSCFRTDAFKTGYKRQGVLHHKTYPYTPKISGMIERLNRLMQPVYAAADINSSLRCASKVYVVGGKTDHIFNSWVSKRHMAGTTEVNADRLAPLA